MRTSQWDAENRGASEIERHSLTPRLTPSRIAVRRGCAKPPSVSQLVCTIHVWPPHNPNFQPSEFCRSGIGPRTKHRSATTTVLVNGPTRVTKRNSRPTHDQSKEDRDASHKGCAVHILPITFTGTIHRLCYNRFASAPRCGSFPNCSAFRESLLGVYQGECASSSWESSVNSQQQLLS